MPELLVFFVVFVVIVSIGAAATPLFVGLW
jgi:hypothetical protein